MKMHRLLGGLFVLVMMTAPGTMTIAASLTPVRFAESQSISQAEHQPTTLGRAYAAREVASAVQVEKFRGGGTGVYIGGSTVVIVLLVILIVLLV